MCTIILKFQLGSLCYSPLVRTLHLPKRLQFPLQSVNNVPGGAHWDVEHACMHIKGTAYILYLVAKLLRRALARKVG